MRQLCAQRVCRTVDNDHVLVLGWLDKVWTSPMTDRRWQCWPGWKQNRIRSVSATTATRHQCCEGRTETIDDSKGHPWQMRLPQTKHRVRTSAAFMSIIPSTVFVVGTDMDGRKSMEMHQWSISLVQRRDGSASCKKWQEERPTLCRKKHKTHR